MSLEPWWRLAIASVQAGAGVVWFTGGPGAVPAGVPPTGVPPTELDVAGAPMGGPLWCDACTVAAAAPSFVDDAVLGVMSGLPFDRHPAVLARDVTTLDVLSSGRAAVALRWEGTRERSSSSRDFSAVCAYLGEAIAVCRAVLQDEDPVFEGSYFRIAGAVNRPPPQRPDRLPLLVEAPKGIARRVDRDPGVSFLLRQAARGATAIGCADDPREIAAWRAYLVNGVAGLVRSDGKDAPSPLILCRAELGQDAAWSGRGTICSSAASAFAAGADGILVRLAAELTAELAAELPTDPVGGHRRGARRGPRTEVAARVAEQLSACFGPWLR